MCTSVGNKNMQRLKDKLRFRLYISVLKSKRRRRLHTLEQFRLIKSSFPSIRGLSQGAGVNELQDHVFFNRFTKFFLVFLANASDSTLLQTQEFIFKCPQRTGCSIFHSLFSNVMSFSQRIRLIMASFRFLIRCIYSCFIVKRAKTSFIMTRYFAQ